MEKLSVSILDLDFLHADSSLGELKNIGVERIHLDVVDTTFSNNISFGPGIINQILQYDFIFDLHIMIGRPLPILRQINLEPVERVAVHRCYAEVAEYLEHEHPVPGHAIGPSEPVPAVAADYFLVMTVEPGFGGQTLKMDCVSRIKELRRQGKFVGVDGGVNESNISAVQHADLIVVGSALVNAADKDEYCRRLLSGMP